MISVGVGGGSRLIAGHLTCAANSLPFRNIAMLSPCRRRWQVGGRRNHAAQRRVHNGRPVAARPDRRPDHRPDHRRAGAGQLGCSGRRAGPAQRLQLRLRVVPIGQKSIDALVRQVVLQHLFEHGERNRRDL